MRRDDTQPKRRPPIRVPDNPPDAREMGRKLGLTDKEMDELVKKYVTRPQAPRRK